MSAKSRGSIRAAGGGAGRGSIFYGADEYMKELREKIANDGAMNTTHQQVAMTGQKIQTTDKMLEQKTDASGKLSARTGRALPVNRPPVGRLKNETQFLFAKLGDSQLWYMWRFLCFIFVLEVCWILTLCITLALFGGPDKMSWSMYNSIVIPWGCLMAYLGIQHIYIDHDVMHGATYAPFDWMHLLTHPFSDFLSLPWDDFIVEHNQHHSATSDLLLQGEFKYDPEMFQYQFAKFGYNPETEKTNWLKLVLFFPLCPLIHFLGLNDTGSLFAIEWWFSFPDDASSDSCSKEVWGGSKKYFWKRLKHNSFVWFLWTCVWLLGTFPFGRPLSEGWKFVIPVTCGCRAGFGLAWMFITNFTHSPQWFNYITNNEERKTGGLSTFVMSMALGGKHRWNEMLFHDLHHAFPATMGTLSQRGRFHGWERVHNAAFAVVTQPGGIFERPAGQQETATEKNAEKQRKRSIMNKPASKAAAKPASKEGK